MTNLSINSPHPCEVSYFPVFLKTLFISSRSAQKWTLTFSAANQGRNGSCMAETIQTDLVITTLSQALNRHWHLIEQSDIRLTLTIAATSCNCQPWSHCGQWCQRFAEGTRHLGKEIASLQTLSGHAISPLDREFVLSNVIYRIAPLAANTCQTAEASFCPDN